MFIVRVLSFRLPLFMSCISLTGLSSSIHPSNHSFIECEFIRFLLVHISHYEQYASTRITLEHLCSAKSKRCETSSNTRICEQRTTIDSLVFVLIACGSKFEWFEVIGPGAHLNEHLYGLLSIRLMSLVHSFARSNLLGISVPSKMCRPLLVFRSPRNSHSNDYFIETMSMV